MQFRLVEQHNAGRQAEQVYAYDLVGARQLPDLE